MNARHLIDLLVEMPNFAVQGKVATSPEGRLKDLPLSAVEKNIIIFYSKEGNFLWQPGKFLAYFMDTEEAAQDMKDGKIDYIMFIPGSMTMKWNGYSMIKDIWKKGRQGKGSTHIVGMADGVFDPAQEDPIYLDNISVRPGWKRNTIASKLLQAVKDNFQAKMTHSPTTPEGYKLFKSSGFLRHNKADQGADHPQPGRGRVPLSKHTAPTTPTTEPQP